MGRSRRLRYSFRFARQRTTNLYRFWSRYRFGRIPWLLYTLSTLLRSEAAGLERRLGSVVQVRFLLKPILRYSELQLVYRFRLYLLGYITSLFPWFRYGILLRSIKSISPYYSLLLIRALRSVRGYLRTLLKDWSIRDLQRYRELHRFFLVLQRATTLDQIKQQSFSPSLPYRHSWKQQPADDNAKVSPRSVVFQELVGNRITGRSASSCARPSLRKQFHSFYLNFTQTALSRTWARAQARQRMVRCFPVWLRPFYPVPAVYRPYTQEHNCRSAWLQVLRRSRIPRTNPRIFLPLLRTNSSGVSSSKNGSLDFLSWAHLYLLTRRRNFIFSLAIYYPIRRRYRTVFYTSLSSRTPPILSYLKLRLFSQARLYYRLRRARWIQARRRARRLSGFIARLLRYFALSPNLHYRLVYRRPFLLYLLPNLLSPPLQRLVNSYFLTPPNNNSNDRRASIPSLARVARSALTLRRRAPRVFRFFLTRLRQRYGFRRSSSPFRLDIKLPRYRFKKPKERVEQYRLLQTVRRIYGGLTPRQFWRFRRFAYTAQRRSAAFASLLLYESRLDIFLCRTPWCKNLSEAQAFIRRGWICVNGRQVFTTRYAVNFRDIVSGWQPRLSILRHWLLTRWYHRLLVATDVQGRIFPAYLELDFRNLSFTYLASRFSLDRIPAPLRFSRLIVPHWGRFVL